jgi:hypothetical protein
MSFISIQLCGGPEGIRTPDHRLTAVAKAIEMHYIRHGDSFDTFSWTFTRGGVYVNRRGKQRYSAETVEKRSYLFKLYLKRVAEVLLNTIAR